MLQAQTGNNFYKEIPLSEILAVETVKTRTGDTQHYFELRTANLDFFVGSGEHEDDYAGWEVAIRQSLMPAGAAGAEAAGAVGAAGVSGAAGAAGASGSAGGEPCSENSQALDTQVIVIPRLWSVESTS